MAPLVKRVLVCIASLLLSSITNFWFAVDAMIAFPEGVVVAWSSQRIGSIELEDISVTGDVGAQSTVTLAVSSCGYRAYY